SLSHYLSAEGDVDRDLLPVHDRTPEDHGGAGVKELVLARGRVAGKLCAGHRQPAAEGGKGAALRGDDLPGDGAQRVAGNRAAGDGHNRVDRSDPAAQAGAGRSTGGGGGRVAGDSAAGDGERAALGGDTAADAAGRGLRPRRGAP